MSRTIMVVDREKRLLALMENYLTIEGYAVLTAPSGRIALRLARQSPPDLILLDIGLPSDMDCSALMQAYERQRPLPIILFMAHAEELRARGSLELEQRDCLIKPFRPRELVDRNRLAFRRLGEPDPGATFLEAGGITLDKANRCVQVGPRFVDLTPSEFDLLARLMSSPGRVVSRLDLLDILQGVQCQGANKRLIDIHIKNLRSKIEPDPHFPHYIETVYGFGYRFCRTPDT